MAKETWMIVYLLRHDPLPIVGLLLVGISGVLFVHILRKMMATGYKLPSTYFGIKALAWTLPLAYVRASSQQKHWSAWPAYLMWACEIAGLVLLLIGVFQL